MKNAVSTQESIYDLLKDLYDNDIEEMQRAVDRLESKLLNADGSSTGDFIGRANAEEKWDALKTIIADASIA
jgi:uncharacterized protein YbbC (DUF1343 family)